MRFRFFFALLLLTACTADVSVPYQPMRHYPGMFTERVVMRDGAQLATDIHLPRPFVEGKDKPFPVMLIRSPYDKTVVEPTGLKTWAGSVGIGTVAQDTRGRFASEGTDAVFQDDGFGVRQDGYDTVEWIASQPWSNGKVCTFGPSALGITQTMMAPVNPPHLTCQFILVGPANLYLHSGYQGGVLREELTMKWLEFQEAESWLGLILAHPAYDSYWEPLNATARNKDIDVPAVHVGGWFDIFSEGTLGAYRAWQHGSGPRARGQQKLVMGPGDHIQTGLFMPHIGPAANASVAGLDVEYLAKLWFSRYLLEEENDIENEPAVRFFVMEGSQSRGEWHNAPDWPCTRLSGGRPFG